MTSKRKIGEHYTVESFEGEWAVLEADPEQTPAFDPFGDDRDCGDFGSQAEAQAFYEAAGGPGKDPHRLDSEGDGVAC